MNMQAPFIWGQGGTKLTPAQAKAMRDVAAALAARRNTPQNLGEGLASVGDALLYNSNMARANEAESAGMEQVAQALADARAAGGSDGYYEVLSNPWASEGQRLVAGSLLDRGYQLEDRNAGWAREDAIRADERAYNEPLRDAQLEGFNIQNETGQVNLDQMREGYTPLVTPEERAAIGIDPADTSVWYRGPDGRPYNEGAKGAGVTINTGDGSSQWNKTLDENNAKRYIAFQDEGVAAQRALNSFAAMDQLLADPKLYSGAGGEQVLAFKRIASAMGMNPEGVTSAETFNALSKQAALDVMGGSLGTGFSNADRDFVIDQVANLGNTPEGNRRIVAIQQKLAQRKIEISQLATAYVQRFGQLDEGFDNVLRKYAEENPLFPKKEAGALPEGVTEDDIEHTMKVHGLTREEVLKRIGHAS